MKLPLIYVAGPFRGPTPYDVHTNVIAAEAVGLLVAQHTGGYPVIPHTMTQHFDQQLTDEFWLAGTLEMLRRCDAVCMMSTWRLSGGATAEREEALRLGIPVFETLIELGAWVKDWRRKYTEESLG